ncbi:MAG: hypothetical protein ACW964_17180 [Candidatus Hodarchaeales archaeon]
MIIINFEYNTEEEALIVKQKGEEIARVQQIDCNQCITDLIIQVITDDREGYEKTYGLGSLAFPDSVTWNVDYEKETLTFSKNTLDEPNSLHHSKRKYVLIEEDNCAICRQSINSVQELVHCPKCNSPFHDEHFAEALKVKGLCPVCNASVKIVFDE